MARGKYLSDCERGLIIGAWCGAGASGTVQLAIVSLGTMCDVCIQRILAAEADM